MNKKWVWFDLDDTLHEFGSTRSRATSSILSIIADKTGLPVEQVRRNYQQVLEQHGKLQFADGRLSHEYRRERFEGAIEGHGLTANDTQNLMEFCLSEYERLYMDSLKLKPNVSEVLQTLRQKGYGLAVLTNGPDDAQNRVMKKLGLNELVDHVFTAGGLRISKKNGMLRVVLDRLALDAGDVTMVGDMPEHDILPALALGIKPIWFNDKRMPNESGWTEIQTLDEIPELLGI